MKVHPDGRTARPSTGGSRWPRRPKGLLFILLISGVGLAGSARRTAAADVSPAPGIPWTPSAEARRDQARPTVLPPLSIPEALRNDRAHWTLSDLVSVALAASPETRAAWEDARAAAARHAGRRSLYLPRIDATADAIRQKSATAGDRDQPEQTSYGADLGARWLLFDFGGREARRTESRQALVAANWSHNAGIQNVILDVQQAYLRYVTARALRAAEESSLREAGRNLESSEARHRAGLATIADVLQARTALSQARLALDGLEGAVQTSRGALATVLGLPVDFEFDVVDPDDATPVDSVAVEVEGCLERARRERPDLAAARARYESTRASLTATRTEGYPSLEAGGSLGRRWFDSPDDPRNRGSASIEMSLPLFTGFAHRNDVRAAEAETRAAGSRLEGLKRSVDLEVWTSYFDWRTALQRLKTSGELLASAGESHRVAAGRYEEGVGSILDLLSAQAALENARALQVEARADWYLAMARLAHATGTLGAPAAGPGIPFDIPGKDREP